ncbi:MAG: hypothetical protein M3015_13220 [Bacteroidota bacterium]|nr:hypothetical protein [Bacteroidota bacterium]
MKNLLGGFAGALALNLLHETYKRIDSKAPRIDLVGEEALSKIIERTGNVPPKGDRLYTATLAGDIVSNTFYYALIGYGNKESIITRGTLLGLAAGVGALTLTKPLGLSNSPVTRTKRTKALTVAWYIAGGVVAALTIRALDK